MESPESRFLSQPFGPKISLTYLFGPPQNSANISPGLGPSAAGESPKEGPELGRVLLPRGGTECVWARPPGTSLGQDLAAVTAMDIVGANRLSNGY